MSFAELMSSLVSVYMAHVSVFPALPHIVM